MSTLSSAHAAKGYTLFCLHVSLNLLLICMQQTDMELGAIQVRTRMETHIDVSHFTLTFLYAPVLST